MPDLRSTTLPLLVMLSRERKRAQRQAIEAGRRGDWEQEAAYFCRAVDLRHVIQTIKREVSWECEMDQAAAMPQE